MTTYSTALDRARFFLQTSKLEAASAACRQALAQDGTNPEAWFLLACIAQQQRLPNDALAAIGRATALDPGKAVFHSLAADILHDLGKLSEAEQSYRRAVSLQPEFPRAWNSLGITLVDLARQAEASECFKRAVSQNPAYHIAWNNLGSCLESLGRIEDAKAALMKAISINPKYASAHYNLANLHLHDREFDLAIKHANQVLAINPRHDAAHFLLGSLYRDSGEATRATQHFREAARLNPRNANYLNWLGESLAGIGDYESAVASFQQALEIAPRNLKASICAALLIPTIYRDTAHIETTRQKFSASLDALIARQAQFLENKPADLERDVQWANFYLAYHGCDDRALQVRYAGFVRAILEAVRADLYEPLAAPQVENARLRIVFVSHHFYNCTAGHYFKSWITRLDNTRFETVIYHTNVFRDEVTHEIESASEKFVDAHSFSLFNLADRIKAEAADILIYPELGMNGTLFALASFRLAPLQCSAWGHPVTSGHQNIDIYLSCAIMEPDNAPAHYAERLELLPEIGTNYSVPETHSNLARADLGLPVDKILYLVPQSLFKIHPDNDELYLDILSEENSAVLVMLAPPDRVRQTNLFIERLEKGFARRSLPMVGRVKILQPMSRMEFLRLNQLCDVMLDTMHWSGGNTSLDALSAGLPIVTLPGQFMRGRQSCGMLAILGCEELIARDRKDYVSIALRTGRDPKVRNELSRRILDGRGKLFSRDEPIRALESILLSAAGRHATGQNERLVDANQMPPPSSQNSHLGQSYSVDQQLCLAIDHHQAGRLSEAEAIYQQVLQVAPNNPDALHMLGLLALRAGQNEIALERVSQAIRFRPNDALFFLNLGHINKALNRLAESISCYRKAVSRKPGLVEAHSNLLFTLHHDAACSPSELFEAHLQFARQFEAPLLSRRQPFGNTREPERRLKIGYVSADFWRHSVAYFIEPILARHDRSRIEVFCYYNQTVVDDITRQIIAHADHWVPCTGMSDDELAERIRSDGIDILVDLSGHTAGNRLPVFARKPAPVQVTWVGYAGTTGLSAMDYRITTAHLDPPGLTERFHTETLIRLASGVPFQPAADAPPVNELPALTSKGLTFACLNSVMKINPGVVAVWGRILAALPTARLILGNVDDAGTEQQLMDMFANEGIPAAQLTFTPRLPLAEYLALHHQIDLALDPFPYNGGTTSFHALWMGVPVLTLPGDTTVSRCGAAVLHYAGLTEFIAQNRDEYVELALRYAQDLPKLNRIRQALREKMASNLENDPLQITRSVEAAYREMWKTWCASGS